MIAHIVPISCLKTIENKPYHMCLAQLVLQNDKYANFYRKMVEEGKYVIMDNGAAEGEELWFEDLLNAYDRVKPSEIIMPDVLWNKSKTISKSSDFDRLLNKNNIYFNKMIVPQGKRLTEWCKCIEILMGVVPDAKCVGIPKWLGSSDPKNRVEAVRYVRNHYPDVDIHLLGCVENPSIVGECKKISSKIRGCDSVYAYTCAKAGLTKIDRDTVRPGVKVDLLNDQFAGKLECLMNDFEKTAEG